MKNWVSSNLGLKFISVLFAIGLWMAVVSLSDPVTTKNFKNIPVMFNNEAVLTENGKVYEVLDNSDHITITVKAKRSIVEALEGSDFQAVADFSERISENAVPIKVTAQKYEDEISDISMQNNTVKVSIEDKVVKEIPVDLQTLGNAGDGFTVGNVTVSPDKITVSGPQSVVDKIESVQVLLDATNITEDVSMKTSGVLIDKNDREVSDSRIQCDTMEFQVEAKLLHTKSVDLDFLVEGTVADGFRYVDMDYTPTTLLIAGELADLDQIATIQIPSSELNMDGANGNLEKEVNVSQYLPENVRLVNEEEKIVKVTLHILSLATQTVTFPVSRIDVLNTPSGMDMEFANDGSIELKLQGLSEDFADFSFIDNVAISVDLKGLSEGEHRLKTTVTTEGNLTVVDAPYVTVILKSRDDISDTVVVDPTVTDSGSSTVEDTEGRTSNTHGVGSVEGLSNN